MNEFEGVERGLLPALPAGLERPLESSDVSASVRDRIEPSFEVAFRWLERPVSTDTLAEDLPILAVILQLCGEHAQPQVWTTPESLRLSYRVQSRLKAKFECPHMAEVIMSWHGRLLNRCLSDLRTRTRDWADWRSHLAAAASCIWFFDQLTLIPCRLSESLSQFLPLLLKLADDWYPPHQEWGLLNLTKVLRYVSCQELVANGRWNVIVNALKGKLRSTDLKLRQTAWTSFVLVLEILELNTVQQDSSFNECDQFASVILDQLQSNWSPTERLFELQTLRQVLVLLRYRLQRWLSRLLAVLDGCLSLGSLSETDALEMLRIIRFVVSEMGDQINPHQRLILQTLIRFEVHHKPMMGHKSIALSECLAIVAILREADPPRYAKLLEGHDQLRIKLKILNVT
ncbi:uncharacterized protein LOC131877206 isoform X1 [Tigriopus californicus]|uniref:uncharacterized protein LOC131877206 isoform X1 n=1 Tax=Tigriopus californicus TaxID=6832 RepID=UPI0027DA4852|nr:uncharacterized protein LOC131877206 isoform X1 [Tigriopus californicus]